MLFHGHCHCGKLKVAFQSEKTPHDIGVRTCQCAFCRSHGAVNVSDPAGFITIDAWADDMTRYRFGLMTADFLICRHCGVYCVAAMSGHDADKGAQIYATINIAGLAMSEFADLEEAPMDYAAETTDARIERRYKKWTPTRFTDAALNAATFGKT
ncbi:MAG: aldehyde-activating protein [Pseudomonadota bacterium]